MSYTTEPTSLFANLFLPVIALSTSIIAVLYTWIGLKVQRK
ncbi:MAG: hypothetical protein PF517_09545 [Salinivirgaceae bacterium]|nr:hypothetical protein [Salinivirgaceae bacterium]